MLGVLAGFIPLHEAVQGVVGGRAGDPVDDEREGYRCHGDVESSLYRQVSSAGDPFTSSGELCAHAKRFISGPDCDVKGALSRVVGIVAMTVSSFVSCVPAWWMLN